MIDYFSYKKYEHFNFLPYLRLIYNSSTFIPYRPISSFFLIFKLLFNLKHFEIKVDST